ncbi:putative protein N(5)-glutamine methyltransferase [Nocardioidaceae bacterium SCSIO 66511]|nr:putative protein N(5)-glutamine methyltransferase [Nocardioidaceae bacterium SCSIO 66511]
MAEPPPAIVESLRRAGCVFAEDEAQLLTEAAQSAEQLAAMVEQRVSGTPLEHLLGWVEFAGLRIAVDDGLFVPRRRTEVLVRETLNVIRPGGVVLELCCGVAAVATAVAAESDGVEVHAADLDPAAVRCAVRNLASVGGKAYESDLFDSVPESLRGRVDVLVANAPYVPTDAIATMPPEAREYEPRESLEGGPDGVDLHRRIADGVRDWLAPGGHLIIETSERQVLLTMDAFTRNRLEAKVARAEDVDGTAVVGSAPR